eukprot:CAMPEP_0195570834 /NCGR_PEP_ID=MMETSP0814-20130614/3720_1 /TAXON_ID=97485 /ORGANISM="Prymnesium parvum, Strain Texoma1" /LENGTH=77 /DNA_ID=CAMNT_0040706391 /DNA_START=213 /DNA_END=443 /DNA_ORIENTATION=-
MTPCKEVLIASAAAANAVMVGSSTWARCCACERISARTAGESSGGVRMSSSMFTVVGESRSMTLEVVRDLGSLGAQC